MKTQVSQVSKSVEHIVNISVSRGRQRETLMMHITLITPHREKQHPTRKGTVKYKPYQSINGTSKIGRWWLLVQQLQPGWLVDRSSYVAGTTVITLVS